MLALVSRPVVGCGPTWCQCDRRRAWWAAVPKEKKTSAIYLRVNTKQLVLYRLVGKERRRKNIKYKKTKEIAEREE